MYGLKKSARSHFPLRNPETKSPLTSLVNPLMPGGNKKFTHT